MISFWVMVFFLIGDSACSSSEIMAKEGSCVTVHITLYIWDPGYTVWLKDAVWNDTAKDYEGTIVHSLKPDKLAASEFKNRVSVGSTESTRYSRNYELTINNLRLNDSGKYSVRYYDKAHPPYKVKMSSKPEMSLEVEKNPCQVSVTGPELVQTGAEVILRCSTVGRCQNSPEWRSSRSGLASSEGSDIQGAKTAQLSFKADWSHDGVTFSCWPSLSNDACASRNITLAVEYGPRGTKIKASCCQGGVKAGESLTLTCETDARPEPNGYTWFRTITEPGGQRGPGRTEVAVPSNGRSDGRYLRFWQISAGDAGKYMCQAKNIVSAEKSTALRVDVLYMPQISGSGSCSRTEAEISCSCESRGNPSPSMEWHVSGLRVTNSTERVIREEKLGNTGLRSSLTMRQSQGDTPTLLCVSTNTLGNSSLQLHLPSPQQHSGFTCNPLLLIINVGLICLYVLTVGFCIHKNKRLSRRLKGGRDGDTYASLQLSNMSPEYDVLQVKNKYQKDTGTTQDENDDYQNPEDGNRPDSGAN